MYINFANHRNYYYICLYTERYVYRQSYITEILNLSTKFIIIFFLENNLKKRNLINLHNLYC